ALFLALPARALPWLGGGILLAYWGAMTLVPVPRYGPPDLSIFPEGGTVAPNLATWVDMVVLGRRAGPYYPHDPEGLLTTLPALVTTLIGVLAGRWLQAPPGAPREKIP